MDSRNKRLAKNTMILYVRMAFSMVVSLYTSRIVLRVLGFDDFGLYGVIGGIVSMFTFLNGAMSGASSRFISIEIAKNDIKQLNKVFCTLFWSHVGIALLVILLSETVGLWFLWNKLVIPEGQKMVAFWVYQISIISTLFSITQVPYSAMIISHENMKVYAYVGLVDVILKLLIVFALMIIPGSKLLVWAILGLSIQIGINIFYRIYVRRKYQGSELHIVKDKARYRIIFGYVGSDLIGNISVLAQGQGLNILLNLFFGPAVNAARSIAYTIQGVTQQFSSNFLTALRPQIIKLYGEGKPDAMVNLSKRGSCLGFYLLWIIALPVILNAPYALKIWLGKYPEYSVPFLQITILIALIQVIKTPRTMALHAIGKLKWPNIFVGGFLILTFPVSYVFLKLGFGPTSVFWITFVDLFLSEFISIYFLRKYVAFNVLDYFKDVHCRCIGIALVSFTIPCILKYFYPQTALWPVLLNCITCVFATIITVYIFGLNHEDRNKIIGIIKCKLIRNA